MSILGFVPSPDHAVTVVEWVRALMVEEDRDGVEYLCHEPGASLAGEACVADPDCIGGLVCREERCTVLCDPGNTACPPDTQCQSQFGSIGVCLPKD